MFNCIEYYRKLEEGTHENESENPESADSKMLGEKLKYLASMTGVGGFERKNVLRTAFKSIINNIIPAMCKIWIYYFRQG